MTDDRLGKSLLMGLIASLLISAIAVHNLQSDWQSSVSNAPIKLWQLPKDIERDPVPVTGKVRDLRPPRIEEHNHVH